MDLLQYTLVELFQIYVVTFRKWPVRLPSENDMAHSTKGQVLGHFRSRSCGVETWRQRNVFFIS